jgi:hypothetical protein
VRIFSGTFAFGDETVRVFNRQFDVVNEEDNRLTSLLGDKTQFLGQTFKNGQQVKILFQHTHEFLQKTLKENSQASHNNCFSRSLRY